MLSRSPTSAPIAFDIESNKVWVPIIGFGAWARFRRRDRIWGAFRRYSDRER